MPIANGNKIRELREDAGFSQAALAERGGVARATIRRAEKSMNVTITSIRAIAHALSIARGRDVTAQDITVEHTSVGKNITDISPITQPNKLREILAERGITQKEVAYETEISQAHLSAVLAGKRRLRPDIAARILDFLENYPRDVPPFDIERIESTPIIRNDDNSSRLMKLRETADTIPAQNLLIRFGVSSDNKLELIPSPNDENDYGIIEALRSELLASDGPIATLNERYATNPNLPQSSLFKPLTEGYDKELSKDPKDINYAVLYAKGARFYAARRTAAQQVASGEWPELGADEADAVDAICDLHGPLIMASSVGRRMVSDAHEYETTPEVYRNEQDIVEELGHVISAETEIFEAETVEDIQALTPPIENDPQPARTRRAGILVAGSVLTVVVGGAAWLAGGSTALYFAVPAAAGYWSQKYAWEVLKKTDAFKDSSDEDAKRADALIKQAEEQIGPTQKRLMEKMSELIERQRPLFERLANLRPEFGWAKKYLDKTEQITKVNLPQISSHVVLVSMSGEPIASIGEELANKFGLEFEDIQYLTVPNTAVQIRGSGEVDALAKAMKRQPLVVAISDTFPNRPETWELFENDIQVFLLESQNTNPNANLNTEAFISKLSDIRIFARIKIGSVEETVEHITAHLLKNLMI